MKAGFIGLGAMGAPMAVNLARAGYLRGVWNRSTGKAQALADELGVRAAATPAELASEADILLICVSADTDVLAVVEALRPGLRSGHIVVDHSTVSAATARAADALVRSTGAAFLDVPVTGGVEGARAASLAMMAGGEAEDLERARPVLNAMATRIAHMGPVGYGQASKAVNQIMAAGINQAVTEALAFGQAQDLDMDKLIDVVAGGAAGNWFLNKRGPTMTRGVFEPGFKLALHHKDLMICLQMAEAMNMDLPLTRQTLIDYASLMERGHGSEDISALYRLKRQATD
ncbi:NAD(P)-dependent oxidoreductase [Methyloterricola oryzae]|uniref:NAD(P)-dependent oxidoreductase n=1 Tax=Methyloterricola oryzae TaxID=1495050 RepID=UPI0005EB3F36|nr:NAD(P)-dependent oxidoreductase [Methyloterricola oryzae]